MTDQTNGETKDTEFTAAVTEKTPHDAIGHVHGPGCSHQHPSQDPFVRASEKVGRNDLCPCGSQQKFKKCHGK